MNSINITKKKSIFLAIIFLGFYPVNQAFSAPLLVSWKVEFCDADIYKKKNKCKVQRTKVTSGSAEYIGNGLFLTAAHVVEPRLAIDQNSPFEIKDTFIKINGVSFKTLNPQIRPKVGLFGEYDSNHGDVAILRLSQSDTHKIGLPEKKICDSPEVPGNYGIISTTHGVKNIRFLNRKEGYGIYDVASLHGDSGGGVYKPSGCLAGVISRQYPINNPKYTMFTPSEVITRDIDEAKKMIEKNSSKINNQEIK